MGIPQEGISSNTLAVILARCVGMHGGPRDLSGGRCENQGPDLCRGAARLWALPLGLLFCTVGMTQTGRPSIPSTQTANRTNTQGQNRTRDQPERIAGKNQSLGGLAWPLWFHLSPYESVYRRHSLGWCILSNVQESFSKQGLGEETCSYGTCGEDQNP